MNWLVYKGDMDRHVLPDAGAAADLLIEKLEPRAGQGLPSE